MATFKIRDLMVALRPGIRTPQRPTPLFAGCYRNLADSGCECSYDTLGSGPECTGCGEDSGCGGTFGGCPGCTNITGGCPDPTVVCVGCTDDNTGCGTTCEGLTDCGDTDCPNTGGCQVTCGDCTNCTDTCGAADTCGACTNTCGGTCICTQGCTATCPGCSHDQYLSLQQHPTLQQAPNIISRMAASDLPRLKRQLRVAMQQVTRRENVLAAAAEKAAIVPRTIAQVDALEKKLSEALEELRSRRAQIEAGAELKEKKGATGGTSKRRRKGKK